MRELHDDDNLTDWLLELPETELVGVMNRGEALIEANIGWAEAEQLLTRNTRNRGVTASNVRTLHGAYVRGEYVFDATPIRFGTTEQLMDAQHRLLALDGYAGKLRFLIVTNLDLAAYRVIDGGKKRTFADDLSVQGVANVRQIQAIVRRMLALEGTRNARIAYSRSGDGVNYSRTQMEDYYKANKFYIDNLAREALRLYPEHTTNNVDGAWPTFPGGPSILAILLHTANLASYTRTTEFFETMREGATLTLVSSDPRRAFRTFLFTVLRDRKVSPNVTVIAANFLIALRAYENRKPLSKSKLNWVPEMDWPEL